MKRKVIISGRGIQMQLHLQKQARRQQLIQLLVSVGMRKGQLIAKRQHKESPRARKPLLLLIRRTIKASKTSARRALRNRNRQTANTPTQMVSQRHNPNPLSSNMIARPQSQKPPSKPRLQPQTPPRPTKTNHNHHHQAQQHQITPQTHPILHHYYQRRDAPPHQPRTRPPPPPKIKHLHTPTPAPAPTTTTSATSKARRRPFPRALRGRTPA